MTTIAPDVSTDLADVAGGVDTHQDTHTAAAVDSARALSILADVLARTGEPDRALALYESATQSLEGHENEAMLIDLYRRWSDLLAHTGRTEEALEIARRAIAARQSVHV